MLPAVEPQRPAFSLAGAGSVLIGFTAACIVAGTLIGWAVGKLGLGSPSAPSSVFPSASPRL